MGHKTGRGGVPSGGAFCSLHDRQQLRRQFLAEFHAPLIERVDAEQLGFDEHAVFIERNETAEGKRIEFAMDDRQ